LSGFVVSLLWLLLFIGGGIFLAYQRIDLRTSTVAAGIAVLAYWIFGDGFVLWKLALTGLFGLMIVPNLIEVRREKITKPLLEIYRRILPSMSDTEREALEAGNVWWDGELFSGMPEWDRLMSYPAPKLSEEEQAFLDGPCEELCGMLDDWEISHKLADLPKRVWDYIIEKRFFAMIIPKQYGGLEFSAYANSCVLRKIASRNATAGSTIGVPNSLGPAELLMHYGTDEQKQRYLPGLAAGTEIPCFALTSPLAGSDAASLIDSGVVCKGKWQGEEIIGIRLNWDKRYITLAPVATVLGLAFKLYDPDHLIGDKDEYGITAALVPTDTKGVEVGRRHYPLSIPFQNGPTTGKDVFLPLDCIIGGTEMAGKGWKMLVELLSVGRAISLPSAGAGGGQAASYATGAYAVIRKQFNTSIANFEGVGEALTRIAGNTYIMNAALSVTAGAIDQGEKPAVPSAILKYHCTELGRKVSNDAMDVHGGKGIMMGPSNYLGRAYMATPIAITVEGANILTRSLIIYGQGAIRCHPFVLRELHAARDEDQDRYGAFVLPRVDSCQIQSCSAEHTDAPLLPEHQSIQCRLRAGFGFRDVDPGWRPEETRTTVGAVGRRIELDVPGIDRAQAFRKPGTSRDGPAPGRVVGSYAHVPGAGIITCVLAQLPEPLRGGPASCVHFPARPHLLVAFGRNRGQSRRDRYDAGRVT
jgi:acyl-CoA dehydrogenase